MSDALLQRVQRTIARHQMLTPGETVVIGVSGGVDSMVLLRVLLELRERYRLSLHVAHVNHGLRGVESAEAAAFVGRQCEGHEVAATITVADPAALRDRPGGSLQNAARNLRYRFIERVKIAMGHHQDDQAETVLMNLLRGSGTRGLGGIPPVRGRIIRPLIECSRKEIEAYALHQGIPYVEDSSNDLLSYSRNRIRLQLLPELAKGYNPRVAEALASAAAIFAAEDALLTAMTEEQLPAMVIFRSDRELVLSVPRASPVPTSLRRRILRRSAHLLRGDRPGFSFRQTLALERLLLSDKAQGALHLSGGIHATKAGDRLILSLRAHGARDSGRPIRLAVPGQTELPTCSLRFRTDTLEGATGGLLANDPWTALLDADRAGGELVVRFWERGDRFVPLGMRGRKKLQDFFVDARVPRDQRWTVPLVVSGGEIAWVVGFRVDERFKVTDSTQRILRLRVAHAGAPKAELGRPPIDQGDSREESEAG
ncbi:MAG: putative ATPase [candidate division NC10 bacterium]|nr:putative ATPase [candidate division NC10 bacterium]